MDIEELVRDTFADHEHLAPREADVLACVERRVHRRRVPRAPLAVAASAVVVAAAGVGAVALSRQHTPAPGPRSVQAAPDPTRSPSTTPGPRGSGAPTATTIPPVTMPFDLGWLPTGRVHYLARRLNIGGAAGSPTPVFDGEYMLTVHAPAGPLEIDVQQMPGGLGSPGFKCGSGVPTTIAGRPAVTDANAGGPCGYEVYFRDSAGGVMYVNVSPPPGHHASAATVRRVGRHVAARVHLPGTTRITPAFGIGWVPDGQRVRTFDLEHIGNSLPGSGLDGSPTTAFDIGTDRRLMPDTTVGMLSAPVHGKPGRTVQGHRTRYATGDGWATVDVLHAVGDRPIAIQTPLGLHTAYRIADGLVLPT